MIAVVLGVGAIVFIGVLTVWALCVAAKHGDRMEDARRRLDAESQGRRRVGL
jgi:hypothetical protein